MPALPDLFSPVTKLIIPCCMLRHRLGADQLKAWCVGCLHSDQRRIYMLFEPVVYATIHRCSQPLVNVRNTHSLGSTNRSHLRFLRHRFSPKPKVIATPFSLPKRNLAAKEAVSAALRTRTRQRSERHCKPNDAPRMKPRLCVNTMLCDPLSRRWAEKSEDIWAG